MYYLQKKFGRCHTFVFILPFIILITTICPVLTVSAANVNLIWDANSEPDLAGYKLFYGTASGHYDVSVDVGNTNSYTIANLSEGTTYYFAAVAYDASHNESAYSEELVFTVKAPNSAPDIPGTPTGPSTGYVLRT